MEDQKIINLLDNIPNQSSKFRTRNWVEINDARGTYITNSQIKFKTTMLKSSLCDYGDVYILFKRTIIVVGLEADKASRAADKDNKETIFKNCVPFTNCITGINNT